MRASTPYGGALLGIVAVLFATVGAAACASRAPTRGTSGPKAPPLPSAPEPADAAPTDAAADPIRAPSAAELGQIRQALADRVRDCFAAWAATKPTARASVAFDLVYDRFGILSALRPAPSDAPEATVACFRSAVAETRIAPRETSIAVRLPFELTPPPKGPKPP